MKKAKIDRKECGRIRRELLEAFDGERLGELESTIAAHLHSCHQCHSEWEQLQILDGKLERSGIPDPGASYWVGFVPGLRRRMQEDLAKGRRDLAWLPSFALAAGVAVLMILSPARVSPPSWWLSEEPATVAGAQLTQQELTSLDQALQQDQGQNSYLDEVERELIETFSASDQVVAGDPLETLSTMSDASLEMFFKRLKSQVIIRS